MSKRSHDDLTDAVVYAMGALHYPSLPWYIVFHNNQVHQELDSYPWVVDVPEGAYVYCWTKQWMRKYLGQFVPIKASQELPQELKMLCLVMGIAYE